MPIADWSPDDETPDARQRIPRLTGMGYRLAAAGPRTRQRLIEREAGFPPPDDVRYAIPLAAVLPQTDTPWPAPIGERIVEKPGRLFPARRGFPVWRSLALVTSAVCGFSLVLFGQTLHLDRKLAAASKTVQPALADQAPDLIGLEARTLTPSAPDVQTAALDGGTAPVFLTTPVTPATRPALRRLAEAAAPTVALADTTPTAHAPAYSAPVAARAARALPRGYAALAQLGHHAASLAVAPTAPDRADWRRLAAARPTPHDDLPSWLTHPRPEPQAAPPSELVMSPPPQTLDDQLAARTARQPQEQTAAADPSPPPRPRNLPPIPGPHGPPIIYAEAHYPQPRPYLPPPSPYYGYGYYQPPAPYYYRPPPQYAW